MSKKKRKRTKVLRGKFYTTFHTGLFGHPSLVFRLNRKIKKSIKDLVHRAERAANWCAAV